MVRMSAWLIGMMLLSFMLTFNAHSQAAKRLGLNTTLRTFGEEIKYIQELGVETIRVPTLVQWDCQMQKETLVPPGTLCLNSGWKKKGNDFIRNRYITKNASGGNHEE